MSTHPHRGGTPPLLDVLAQAQHVAELATGTKPAPPAPYVNPLDLDADRNARVTAALEQAKRDGRRDKLGRPISPQQTSEWHQGIAPRTKGRRYPADPPTTDEIIAVMRQAGVTPFGLRTRGLIAVLWRAGLRIHEALLLTEHDLDEANGSILVRRGKGGKRRLVGMDEWGWQYLQPWRDYRTTLPVGPLFCVIKPPTAGDPWAQTQARAEFRTLALRAGVRRRFAPHQLRHCFAVQSSREGVAPTLLQRQLGHANLGVTSIYLTGIDSSEIVETFHSRRAPTVSAAALLDPMDPGAIHP
jgi:integrase